jgi:hypothetical protein
LQGRLERLEDAVARIKEHLESGRNPFGNAAQGEGVAPAVLTRRDEAIQIQDALAPILERLTEMESSRSPDDSEGNRGNGPNGAFVF